MRKLTTLVIALAFSAPALASFSTGNEDLYGWAAHRGGATGSVTAIQPGIGDRLEQSRQSPRDTGYGSPNVNAELYGSVLYDIGHRGF